MLNTPGQDDEDDELAEFDFGGQRFDGPETEGTTAAPDPVAGTPETRAAPDSGPLAAEADEADEGLDDCRPLDDSREQVGFELFDWQADELDALDDELHELGLPHEWVSDGMEVVVHLEDEAAVEALIPKVRYPDELAPEPDVGHTHMRVLSRLFDAADHVTRDPTGNGVSDFLDAAELVDDAPYGIDERTWDAVVAVVDDLVDALHAAAPIDDIIERATRLREGLRPLV